MWRSPSTRGWLFAALVLILTPATRADAVRYKLAGTLAVANDPSFGSALAEGGGRIFVGAPQEQDATHTRYAGAVYVFDARTGGLVRKLTSPVAGATSFGAALALVGDVLVVGEPSGLFSPGSTEHVHLFDAASGALLRTIDDPLADPQRLGFGASLAPFGNRLAIGAPDTQTYADPANQVFALDFPSGDPVPAFVQPAANAAFLGFGQSLAAVGGMIVAGAPNYRPDLDVAGVAYVFDAQTGAFLRTLDNPDPQNTDELGWAMAAVGGAVAISAPSLLHAHGAVYVMDAASGALLQTLRPPSNASATIEFGSSVAAVGDRLLVGAPNELTGRDASVFLFDPASGDIVWDYTHHTDRNFGAHLASDGRDILVDAATGADGFRTDGLVYHFVPTCGDGVLDPCETCDDGNNVSGDGCDANCVLETCGNGVVDPGEQCDDGNDVDGDGCDRGCLATGCGNCIVDPGEECDDGNDATGDHCDPNCTLPRCGNGAVGFGETCDDGNMIGGDGCSATCQIEACGNGVVDAGESCDDGNQVAGDGCDASCHLETARLGWWKSTFAVPANLALVGQPIVTPAGLLTIGDDGYDPWQAQLFDRATGALLHTFPEQNVIAVAGFDGDLWIADAGPPGVVNRYDGMTLELRQSFFDPSTQPSGAFGATLARAGDTLLVRDPSKHLVDVFDAATGAFLRALREPAADDPGPSAVDSFGTTIVAVGDHVALAGNAAAYLLDPATGALVARIAATPAHFWEFVDPIALGDRVLLRAPGVVNVFDGADGSLLHTFAPPAGRDGYFGVYVDVVRGTVLISGLNAVHLFDPTTYAFLRTVPNPLQDGACFGSAIEDTPFGVAISNICAGEDFDGIVHVFDPEDWHVVAALPNERGGDSESQTHTVGGYGTTLLLWHQDDEDGSDALAAAWVPCDDGVLEPGEECDDGNLVSGDGCDLSCTVTRCGNGIVTAGEECDDGNRIAGDGCENDCTVTRGLVCPSPLRLASTQVALRHLGAPAGDETLTFSGRLVPPAGTTLDALDAVAHGAQVRIVDAAGASLLDLSLATAIIPPGPRSGACGRGDGWRTGNGRAIYTNTSGALDAQCTPGSAQGLWRLEIDRRAQDGGLAFRLRVGPSAIAVPTGALRVAIAIGGEQGPAATCGVQTFEDVACARNVRGTTVICH